MPVKSSLNVTAELWALTSLNGGEPEPARYHALAHALAEHVQGPAGNLAWWCKAMGGPDGSDCTLTDVARDAGVPYAHAYYARYLPGEAEAVCAVLTRERDALFTRVLDDGEAHAQTAMKLVRAFGNPEMNAYKQSEAVLADYARARLPIEFVSPEPGLDGRARVLGTPIYPPVTCDRCNNTWTPRVQNPVKCPACQYRFRYERGESPATADINESA